MLITAEYVMNLRRVAKNVDPARVEIYIREAETLDILPAVGAELYRRLSDETYEPTEEETTLLEGGYWNDARTGEVRYFEGLKKALGYLAFARFVYAHAAQVTPFGIVVKSGDESVPADSRTVAAMAADAGKIGREHLAAAVLYWDYVQSQKTEAGRIARKRFVKIGD